MLNPPMLHSIVTYITNVLRNFWLLPVEVKIIGGWWWLVDGGGWWMVVIGVS